MHDQSMFPSDTWTECGAFQGACVLRVLCGAGFVQLCLSRNTSPGTRKLPLSSGRGTVAPVQSLGLRQFGEPLGKTTGSQSQPLPPPPSAADAGLGCEAAPHRGRGETQAGASPWAHSHQQERCVREPRPRHPPGSGLPLQLTDFR